MSISSDDKKYIWHPFTQMKTAENPIPIVRGEGTLLMDENGKTFVIQAGPEFEIKATNELQDLFWSTPSMTARHLLLRGADRLYCLSKTPR